ncbi:MAG TPA: AfsR/SARP family transcriptional regulator, partial [Natronosporangium sp.]
MADAVKDVRFHLLGPFQVLVGQNEITITGRERTLLATLLCHANTPVEVDRLVDAIWGERPPRDARNQLQSVVSRLRRRLVAAGVSETIVMTAPAGYRIKVAPDQLDLTQFKTALADARSAATSDQPGAAVAGYRNALELWRGPALAGVESDLLRRLAASLDEEHLQAIEERLELELALGGAGELVAELTDLVVEHRYREKLHAALMLALYRAGRQAEALAAYQRARRILVDEVGTEPGPVLRELHQRILRDDPTLVASPSTRNVGPTARRCLPRMVADFTGRTEALAQLVGEAQAQRGTTTVIAIDGMAGVGKT